jgi:predicted RNase H-like HicB family nuclease
MPGVAEYTYIVVWDPEYETFNASVLELPLVSAHGDTPEEALWQVREEAGNSVESLRATNQPVPKPFGYNAKAVQRWRDSRIVAQCKETHVTPKLASLC